jgi:IS5 family transposase
VIDWDKINQVFSRHFVSDKEMINPWVENLYVQYFMGEIYCQTDIPLDSSSLTRWRQRLGRARVKLLLQSTIDAARQIEMIKNTSVNQVIVDTTVMSNAIAYPLDSRLLKKSRQSLVKFAKDHQIALRQNYNREAPKLAAQIGRYVYPIHPDEADLKSIKNTLELGISGNSA